MKSKSRFLFVVTVGLILAVTVLLAGPAPALAVAPTVTSATPDQADQGQSLSVTIAGSDFTGATSVSFGTSVTVDSFTVDNDAQITADISIDAFAAVGARDVSVTNADGTGTLVGGFTVDQAPPEIISVSPNEGSQGQTLDVTITGNYFTGASSVEFGSGITTNSYVVNPLSAPSEVQVGSGTAAVYYPFTTWWHDSRTQSILLASEIGQPGEIQKLRLYCSTRPGQNLSHFYIRMQHTAMSSFPNTSYVNTDWTTVLHATNVNVATWTVPGWVEFEFTTPFDYDGVSNLLIDYCLDNGSYTSYGYCHSTAATNRTLTAYGDLGASNLLNTAFGTRQNWYNNVVLVMESSDTIDANITIDGAAALGYRDVSVTTPEGADTLTNGFAVLALPNISSVSPDQALQGEDLDVTITGNNFLGATSLSFGAGITVNSFTADNTTQITASITIGALAAAGARDVSVTNSEGTGTLAGGFTVTQAPPEITSVSPSQGTHLQTYSVTITGNHFNGATSVEFSPDITVNGFTVDSDTQITASIVIGASVAVGQKDVSVTTPGGTATLAGGFTVPGMPTISSVSPAQAIQGQTLSVTITGTNFYGVTSVEFGSRVTVNSFTVDSGTQITANITVDPGAAVGARDVKVTNVIVGWATLTNGFMVNQAPPSIASVNPKQGPQGQTIEVTVTGSYFTGATSVDFGPDITVNSYEISSSAHIVANITIGASAAPGLRDITVITSAGTATLTDGFTILPMPNISSVNPNQALRGQSLSVTIAGTNFLGATAVGFGSGITVNGFTVNDSGEIVVNITVGVNATIGPRTVTVTTPGAVGSLADGFAVVVPSPDIASVMPASGKQGASLEVIITGVNFTGATEVTFGEGVTVDSFTVDSATQITAQISIDAKAAKGERDVSVSTPQASGTMSDGFLVQGKSGAIPLYFWLLVPGLAALGLLVVAFAIKRKKKQVAAG